MICSFNYIKSLISKQYKQKICNNQDSMTSLSYLQSNHANSLNKSNKIILVQDHIQSKRLEIKNTPENSKVNQKNGLQNTAQSPSAAQSNTTSINNTNEKIYKKNENLRNNGSTAKKQLIYESMEVLTPNKVIVECEINGWMQTNTKGKNNTNGNKVKNNRRVPPRPLHKKIVQSRMSELKRRKDQLMRSSCKRRLYSKPVSSLGQEFNKQSLSNRRSQSQQTKNYKDSIQNSSNNSHRRYHKNKAENNKALQFQQKIINCYRNQEWFQQLPLIRVNQFNIDRDQDYKNKKFTQQKQNKATLIPVSEPFKSNYNNAVSKSHSRKNSTNIIKNHGKLNHQKSKEALSNMLLSLENDGNKQNLNNANTVKMNNLLKDKLSKNQYVGLNSISRKTQNVVMFLKRNGK